MPKRYSDDGVDTDDSPNVPRAGVSWVGCLSGGCSSKSKATHSGGGSGGSAATSGTGGASGSGGGAGGLSGSGGGSHCTTDGCRVSEGLIAYYPFTENSGGTIHDKSGFLTPLDLTVSIPNDPTFFEWFEMRNGAKIKQDLTILSGPATKIHDQVAKLKATQEVTLEVWCRSASLGQQGPARIVSYAQDNLNANFMLGQEKDAIYVRLRTPATSAWGGEATSNKSLIEAGGAASTAPTHYVVTYDTTGTVTFYRNSAVGGKANVPGGLEPWDSSYVLSVGNEVNAQTPWHGYVYLIALYDRALSPTEVNQNYNAGSVLD